MSKRNFDIYLDLGSSKIRVSVFDKKEKNQIFFTEKNCHTNLKLDKFDVSETDKVLEETILQLEKKTGEYVNNVNLMLDTSDAFSVSLSVLKKKENKITKDDIQYLIRDAKQQVLNSYINHNIIHIIVNNYKVDDKDNSYLPIDVECKKLSIDIIFICFPKEIIKNLEKFFSKHQISIDKFICSSYAKSFHYKENFTEFNRIAFIDMGYEKTSIIFYENEKLKSFNVLSIGGHHITKDISKILNLKIELSEKLKSNLNKNVIFSEENKNSEIFEEEFLKIINEKRLSLELIKKIIFSRIEETLNLSFKLIDNNINSNKINELKIILIGQGSKILDSNFIDMKETTPLVEEIDFFEETVTNICESGLNLINGNNKQEVVIVPQKPKKIRLFERLFYIFK